MKLIRELYGATQEEIGKAISVNRVTILNWENDTTKASNANLEKLSLFYGIGPEFFYEAELTPEVKGMISSISNKAKKVEDDSQGKRNKVDDFNHLISKTSFDEAIRKYMFASKMLLVTAETGDLDVLRDAYAVNKKIGKRLNNVISLRESEESNDEGVLFDLLNKFE